MTKKTAYPETLIFDLDGTLIDSVPAIHVALNIVLAEEKMASLSLEEVKEVVGFGAKWMVNEIYSKRGLEIEPDKLLDLMARYLDAYMENSAEHTVVYEGVYEVLDELKAAKVKMGICTNKPGLTTQPVLESLKLDHYFSAMITEDDIEHRKPDGRHVLETIKAVAGNIASSVFIGDSETDMAAAANAGIPAICVTYGYCHVPYNELGARALISDFRDLPEELKKLQITA